MNYTYTVEIEIEDDDGRCFPLVLEETDRRAAEEARLNRECKCGIMTRDCEYHR